VETPGADRPGRREERPLDQGAARAYQRDPDARSDAAAAKTGGADGNERLTAWTGAVLFLLLAAEGVTILNVGRLLTLHFFLGMLLLGPVTLKAGSTIYRFCRYYTGSAPYRRKGPPELVLRILGPVIIASTAGVFGSGIMLAVDGPGKGPWMTLHKVSFVIWFCVMTVHVLGYLTRVPGLLAAEFSRAPGQHTAAHSASYSAGRAAAHSASYLGAHSASYAAGRAAARLGRRLGGRGLRIWLLIASLAGGLVIALLTVHLAVPWHVARFGH